VIEPVKELCSLLVETLSVFRFAEPLKGANYSTQYIAILNFQSLLASNIETIKVEISLREPLIEGVVPCTTQTILLNPVDNKQYFSPLYFPCISKQEAYAEKFRAALSRRDPAIRDYFDIDYAIRNLGLNPAEDNFLRLVKNKLAVPGNDIIKDFANQKQVLRQQLETELKPVLRSEDYNDFDLDRAYNFISDIYTKLS
jgi:hypothetical protein